MGRSLFFCVALALAPAGAAFAQAHDDHHAHGGAHEGLSKLTLHDGKKWPTDAPLRESMSAIRAEFNAAHPAIHKKTFTPAQYAALGTSIEKHAATIVAKCKLAPEVDAQFHLVLAELLAGAAGMKQEGDRMNGAVKVVRALEAYGKFFDHPEWKPLDR